MADEINQISQELARDMELLRSSVQRGTPDIDKLGRMSRESADKMKKFTESLGSAAGGLAKNLIEGAEGAAAYNDAMRQGTNAFLDIFADIPVIGKAIKFLGSAATEVGLRMLEASDKIYESYRDASRMGAAGAEGMMGFAEAAERAGYQLKDLEKFGALLRDNSQTLAFFGSTVNDGAKRFVAISQTMRASGITRELMNMGISIDDINRGIGQFVKTQVAMGGTQTRSTQELVRQSTEYIKNLDILSKLTGKRAEELQAERDRALAQEQFAVVQFELRQKANEARARGDEAAAARFETQINRNLEIINRAAKISPELVQVAIGAITGFEGSTKEATMAISTMPGFLQALRDPAVSAADAFQRGGQEAEQFLKSGAGTIAARVGAFDNAFGKYSDLVKLSADTLSGEQKARLGLAQAEQNVTDRATQAQTDLRLEQLATTKSLQSLIKDGIEPTTNALKNLQSTANRLAGVPGGGAATGGAAPAPAANAPAVPPAPTTPMGTNRMRGATMPPGAAGAQQDPLATLNFGGRRGERTGGGAVDPRLIDKARKIQETFPDAVFTALNDVFHQVNRPGSAHTRGLALDFALSQNAPRNLDESTQIKKMLLDMGFKSVRDEYFADRNAGTTGPHFHAELASAQFGRTISGPISGYKVMAHGNEVVIPLGNGQRVPIDMTPLTESLGQNMSVMSEQLERLDELISVNREVVNINRKILQYSQS